MRQKGTDVEDAPTQRYVGTVSLEIMVSWAPGVHARIVDDHRFPIAHL